MRPPSPIVTAALVVGALTVMIVAVVIGFRPGPAAFVALALALHPGATKVCSGRWSHRLWRG